MPQTAPVLAVTPLAVGWRERRDLRETNEA
jgi:hypothetical protein